MFLSDSERLENNDKIVEMKQAIIDQQEGIINLMRNLNDSSTNNNNEHHIQKMLNDMFSKYDDVIQRMQNSEVMKTSDLYLFRLTFFQLYINPKYKKFL